MTAVHPIEHEFPLSSPLSRQDRARLQALPGGGACLAVLESPLAQPERLRGLYLTAHRSAGATTVVSWQRHALVVCVLPSPRDLGPAARAALGAAPERCPSLVV
jgi:hypothetical protein